MLPTFNQEINYTKVKTPSGKTIGIRGWKVKDEKELLFNLESDDSEQNKINYIISFLKNCTDDKNKFDCLSENDIKKICIEIRKLSKGDTIEYNYICPNCKTKIFDEVNITESQVVKDFNNIPININTNLTVTFKDLNWKKTEELYKKFANSNSKFIFYYIINSIDSVTFNGETFTEFTESEMEQFIDNLDSNDLKKMYDEFEKLSSSVELKRTIKCLKCKEDIDINFGEMLSFLVL